MQSWFYKLRQNLHVLKELVNSQEPMRFNKKNTFEKLLDQYKSMENIVK